MKALWRLFGLSLRKKGWKKDDEEDAKVKQVPIAFVAQMLNTTISKAQRKFGGRGHVEMEELIEWVEKHSGHVNYRHWIEMIKKAEQNLAKEPQTDGARK